MLWKIGISSAGKSLRQTTAASHKSWKIPNQTLLPAGTHCWEGYESFFRKESFEYSILVPLALPGERDRVEWDGRLRVHGEQFHFSYFLLPRPCYSWKAFVGVAYYGREERQSGKEREREGDRTVFSIGDASGILHEPILFRSPSSRSRGDSSRASTNSPARDVEEAPRRVRCFRWIDSRALPLCKLPFRRQTLRLMHMPPLGLFL